MKSRQRILPIRVRVLTAAQRELFEKPKRKRKKALAEKMTAERERKRLAAEAETKRTGGHRWENEFA